MTIIIYDNFYDSIFYISKHYFYRTNTPADKYFTAHGTYCLGLSFVFFFLFFCNDIQVQVSKYYIRQMQGFR